MLAQRQQLPRTRAWLLVDALAPEVGALVGAGVALSGHAYAIGLAVYAGIFLMIGTGELLPAAHVAMAALSRPPQTDLARVRRYCQQRVPPHARQQVRLEAVVRSIASPNVLPSPY